MSWVFSQISWIPFSLARKIHFSGSQMKIECFANTYGRRSTHTRIVLNVRVTLCVCFAVSRSVTVSSEIVFLLVLSSLALSTSCFELVCLLVRFFLG